MPSLRDEVAKLIADGFAVVPILRGKKNPADDDWLKKSYTAEDFSEGSNVGVKCGGVSGHRVDVDLDAPEAVQAGQHLLPVTGLIHGRPGKPSSHHWYISPGAVTLQFKGLDGEMLVELRSTGGQTVVPPSVHSTGDVLRWEHNGTPLTLPPADLIRGVQATAIAALFGRHWPSGSRHVAAMHLAGFLLRVGFDGTWTKQIVRTAALIARDEEVSDRERAAADTIKKHETGGKTSGGPKLAELFGRGKELAARVYQWMGREGDDLLDELNERHFVADLGSDTVVCTENADADIVIQDFESFRRRYYNRYVGKKKLGEWWLSHPDLRRYRSLVFAPPPRTCHPEDYNLWRGFAVEPDPNPNPEQRCRLYLEHLFHVICDSNEANFHFLLNVLALTCQLPGKPTGVAVVLRGESGAGKGSFIERFGSLFGRHFIQVDKQDHVTGKFNQHLADKVVLFADEAVWAGNKQDAGALKRLVTEKTLTIERKFMDTVIQPNCIHLFMATNETWVWPAALKERRGFILDVELKDFADEAYFDALHDEWHAGGAEAFLAVCLQRKVTRLGKLPTTRALEEQQQLSLDPIMQWWCDRLTEGEIGIDAGWPNFVSTDTLYEDFLGAAQQYGARWHRITKVQLTTRMTHLLPRGTVRARRPCVVNTARIGAPNVISARRWGFDLPPLEHCRARFDAITGIKYHWPPHTHEPSLLPSTEPPDDEPL